MLGFASFNQFSLNIHTIKVEKNEKAQFQDDTSSIRYGTGRQNAKNLPENKFEKDIAGINYTVKSQYLIANDNDSSFIFFKFYLSQYSALG